MPKRISDKTIELMQKLYDEGFSVMEIARRIKVSYTLSYSYTRVKQRGFASYGEYLRHLAKQKGFGSRTKYEKNLAKQKGFGSLNEFQENLAKQKGFGSLNEYQEYLAKKRQERPENQELSDLINKRLKELGKNQSWLARQAGVSREMVSKYAQGKSIPNNDRLKKLYSALEVPYQTLDDLLE